MKINDNILSIPPYISTSWKNIASLHLESQGDLPILVVTLQNGVRIEIPRLERPMLETIFAAHVKSMESVQTGQKPTTPPKFPLEALFSGGGATQVLGFNLSPKENLPLLESMGTLLQHNPTQAQGDDLPPEILSKISQLSKDLGIDDPTNLPKPEPQCNCPRCQIAKAMQEGCSGNLPEKIEEEMVSEEDLKFRSWDISQQADKLFIVTNPLDSKEQFNVYLGDPVGCTCGEKHCEHIRAVLNS